jgi:hypothetical protein
MPVVVIEANNLSSHRLIYVCCHFLHSTETGEAGNYENGWVASVFFNLSEARIFEMNKFI